MLIAVRAVGEAGSNEVLRADSTGEAGATRQIADQRILEAWGWRLAGEQNVAGIEITRPEIQLFLDGFTAGLRDRPAPVDTVKAYPDIEKLARTRREKIVVAI